jgi:mono/diheme cytochrome c family protein
MAELRKPRRTVALAMVGMTVALLASGCGAVKHMTATSGNAEEGKPLFKQHCSACHTLAAAEATGIIGPNLDTTFGIVRAQGFDVSTIRDVVRGQIAYPETKTAEGGQGMPADLVSGQDARNVSAFVAECALLPAQDAKDTGFPEQQLPDACK